MTLQLTADVLEAALEGVEQLAGARGEQHHLTLQYVESAQTQVKMEGEKRFVNKPAPQLL